MKPKTEKPMAMPNKLIAVDIFSGPPLCSHLKFQLGFINYKGVRNPEFQEIGRIKAALLKPPFNLR
jgi:hypothetical protein